MREIKPISGGLGTCIAALGDVATSAHIRLFNDRFVAHDGCDTAMAR